MIKRVIAYLLLGLLAYAFFLLWTFPADRAAALLRQQVPQLQLAGVSGTAWSGRAKTVQYQSWRFTRVNWQLKPLALFTGRVEFAIAFDGEGRKGRADVAWHYDNTLRLSGVEAALPMAELAQQLGAPASLAGQLTVKLDEVALNGPRIESATGDVQWHQAEVTAPVAQKLGDYSAHITTGAAGIQAQIRDEGGPLQLEGAVRLTKDGSYHLNAKANLRDPQQSMLGQALQAAGRREPDGRVLLEYSGHL